MYRLWEGLLNYLRGGEHRMPSSCSTPHRIGWAVKQMRAGHSVTRKWKCAGQKLSIVAGSGQAKSYVLLTTASGRSWPFTFGQRDILAEDYRLAE